MKRNTIRSSLLMLLVAVIWGVAFVAQSEGMAYMGPFAFNGIRSILGGIVLLPVIAVRSRFGKEAGPAATENQKSKDSMRTLWIGGLCCGVCLFLASSAQQIGIQYTTVGKAGFITAFYIVLVPVLGLFLRKSCSALVWLAVVLAIAGLYLLCIKDHFTIGAGDLYVLACAFLFSSHILVIDHFSPLVDGVKMSCIQFFVCGVLSFACMLCFEEFSFTAILPGWKEVIYAGVFSSGIAYTLQIVAQKNLDPTIASLLMSLESPVSAVSGWLLIQQVLSGREIAGCVLMFIAVLLAQLPVGVGKKTE